MTCTWEPDFTGIEAKWEAFDAPVQQQALMLATSSLQMLTLNRVGTCPITIRPCPEAPPCGCWGLRSTEQIHGYGGSGFLPLLWDGSWYNCLNCGNHCAPLSEVDLPGPVGFVGEVKVDGVALDITTGDWRLDDGHLLVWQGTGPSPIPKTQNLNLADTEVGTWSITYSRSYPVNLDGRIAVAYLALEFAEALKPKGKCSLPRGVTNVVRAGVTFTVDAGLFVNGLTGIQVVDAYVMKWVPPGSPSRSAQVFVPGQKMARRTNALPLSPPSPYIPEPEDGFGL